MRLTKNQKLIAYKQRYKTKEAGSRGRLLRKTVIVLLKQKTQGKQFQQAQG